MHHNNSQQNKKAKLGCKQAESPIVFYMAKLLAEDEAKEANAPTEQLKYGGTVHAGYCYRHAS